MSIVDILLLLLLQLPRAPAATTTVTTKDTKQKKLLCRFNADSMQNSVISLITLKAGVEEPQLLPHTQYMCNIM